jgi:murein DD-endopeptidase MepM/ murein hydrolase activator NlpD
LPDPRRFYRRVTRSNLPSRLISHLAVLSLVVAAMTAGLAQSQQSGVAGNGIDTGFLVSTVRGADDEPTSSASVLPSLDTLPEEQVAFLERGVPAEMPTQSGVMPTPVPVDPDATPLPGPSDASSGTTTQSTAQSTTQSAPTTRAAQPAPATGRLVWPVPGGSISQYFHAGHLAIDIAAPYGSQVVAAQGGTVTWAGWRNNGGGNVISIDHGNGMRTTYNHLGSIWVSVGQWVGAGQGIGAVGCTGLCTGPHVHFEVVVNGVIDNPLRYF